MKHPSLTGEKIDVLICNTALDTKARMFQYKVLHNILYANKMLFKFGRVSLHYVHSVFYTRRQLCTFFMNA